MPPVPSRIFAGAALGLALAACGSAPPTPATRTAARIQPADFSGRVDNPWFPLRPGSTYRYRGTKDGRAAVEVLRVTHRTKTIIGVRSAVVRDRLYLDGRLAEDTTDWYAQDRRGNVWYFGEATATLDRSGRVESREGSFQAGLDGARPGIYMPAHPRVGQRFAQEHYVGHAEDRFAVVDRSAAVRVPYVSSRRALRTVEWTPLEPKVLDAKYYVRGIGTVLERQLRGPGPRERLELVSFRR
jgi:hypothetical protein